MAAGPPDIRLEGDGNSVRSSRELAMAQTTQDQLQTNGSERGTGSVSQGPERTVQTYRRPVPANKPPITLPEYYNSILQPSSEGRGGACANLSMLYVPAPDLKDDLWKQVRKAPAWEYAPRLEFLNRLFYACKASGIQKCDNEKCTSSKETLRNMIPGPTNWDGFEHWALQLAACLCSKNAEVHDQRRGPQLCALPAVIIAAVDDHDLKPPRPPLEYVYSAGAAKNPFPDWAGTLTLSNVLGTLSWLNGMATGNHDVVLEPIDMLNPELRSAEDQEQGGIFTGLIVQAIDRARSFQLCPHRTWAIAAVLPGKEFNLPALIPPIGKILVLGHVGHDHCTADFCEESSFNFTSVAQLHECQNLPLTTPRRERGHFLSFLQARFVKLPFRSRLKKNEDHHCQRIRGKFRQKLLTEPALAGKPTAWRLDGNSIIDPSQPFMAISHVWADGTGVGAWAVGEVNECLYNFFRQIAEQFCCEGIWWDTICIPQDRRARAQAINNMHENYAGAKITLVHDLYLRNCEWIDAESACFAIVMSSWFTRGWTALELAKSREVKVIFKSNTNGPVIKDLDDDILAKAGEPSSPWRQVATTSILNLRSARKGITDVNGLLTALGPRYTSWSRDKAIISGLLAGIEVPVELSQQEVYQRVLMKLGKISDGNLFHSSATMSRGFSWCPTSLLDVPLASNFSTPLEIQENGDVVGYWGVVGPTDNMLTEYIWKDVHPLTKAATQFALRQSDKHLCLIERKAPVISRALVVKVMRRINEENPTEVHCKIIGPVYFRSLGGNVKAGEMEVRIGDTEGMIELEGETALDYAYRVWEERKKHDSSAVGGIRKLIKTAGPGGVRYIDAPEFWHGTSAAFGKPVTANTITLSPEGWDKGFTLGREHGFPQGWGPGVGVGASAEEDETNSVHIG